MEKAALRQQMRDTLAALKPLDRALQEELVNAAILAEPAWQDAQTVLVYKAKAPELSVVSATNAAWVAKKRVVFPRVEGRRGLGLHAVEAWTGLAPGAFGIDEPVQSRPIAPDQIDLAIVPGLAWSRDGERLGQGGGYYDRLLPQLGGQTFGVGFDEQVVDVVPTEPHDARVGRVIWPAQVTSGQT